LQAKPPSDSQFATMKRKGPTYIAKPTGAFYNIRCVNKRKHILKYSAWNDSKKPISSAGCGVGGWLNLLKQG